MSKRWKTFEAVENPPAHFTVEERSHCYYLFDYNPEADFTNKAKSLINNFKKDPHTSKDTELRYKDKAIREFAHYLSSAFVKAEESQNEYAILVPIPSSIPEGDETYDNRFERLGMAIEKKNEIIKFQFLLHTREDHGHTRETNERNPSVIKENLLWRGLDEGVQSGYIYLIDDVVTSGSHFRACKDLILENIGIDCQIGGIFLARTNREPE